MAPTTRRAFREPLAAKVPEVTAVFWVVKILTTAGGEAVSDYLALGSKVVGGAVELGLFLVGLAWQFRTRRYTAAAYWFLAYAIAIFGCGVADVMHKTVGIPYAGTSLFWGIVLAGVLVVWFRTEGTLSIHSITTRRRELFYWSTVFATFALGTAVGDFTATALGLGYLSSGIVFTVLILMPWLARSRYGLGEVAAFWWAYVLTRPLGASFADFLCKSPSVSGIGFGEARTAVLLTIAVTVLVAYLSVARRDVQPQVEAARD
ncbi:MAG TPA: hypothetical protein VND44_02235 [Acidimicrobiales bacterium]|nr:hypothetical protein [Acidimicrobiales bacterium]